LYLPSASGGRLLGLHSWDQDFFQQPANLGGLFGRLKVDAVVLVVG
jgi:hypothetical protein